MKIFSVTFLSLLVSLTIAISTSQADALEIEGGKLGRTFCFGNSPASLQSIQPYKKTFIETTKVLGQIKIQIKKAKTTKVRKQKQALLKKYQEQIKLCTKARSYESVIQYFSNKSKGSENPPADQPSNKDPLVGKIYVNFYPIFLMNYSGMGSRMLVFHKSGQFYEPPSESNLEKHALDQPNCEVDSCGTYTINSDGSGVLQYAAKGERLAATKQFLLKNGSATMEYTYPATEQSAGGTVDFALVNRTSKPIFKNSYNSYTSYQTPNLVGSTPTSNVMSSTVEIVSDPSEPLQGVMSSSSFSGFQTTQSVDNGWNFQDRPAISVGANGKQAYPFIIDPKNFLIYSLLPDNSLTVAPFFMVQSTTTDEVLFIYTRSQGWMVAKS